MNKRWLIKINGENNLYYDSERSEYRLRLLCPHCHKPSTCQCYQSYEDYEYDKTSEFPEVPCSYRCCISECSDKWKENITKAAQDILIDIKPLADYTEDEAEQIVNHIVEKCEFDLSDESAGEQCGI